jgi:hypothetical protein
MLMKVTNIIILIFVFLINLNKLFKKYIYIVINFSARSLPNIESIYNK